MNRLRNFAIAAIVAMAAFGAVAQDNAKPATMSLADARDQISEAAQDPAKLAEIMKQLSSEDQIAFLGDVNAAIADMPGISVEERTARFLDINKAALLNANKDNVANMLAEVFATVTPEALTVVNERFAAELFNRAADPSVTYTDEQFAKIAQAMVDKIQARTANSDDGGVRSAMAAVMFVRASNGTPADLATTLTANMDTAVQEMVPAAVAGNYDAMLGAADAGDQPDGELVVRLRVSLPQTIDAILADMVPEDISGDVTANLQARFADPQTPSAYVLNADGSISLVPWDPSLSRDQAKIITGEVLIGYSNQTIGGN